LDVRAAVARNSLGFFSEFTLAELRDLRRNLRVRIVCTLRGAS